MQMRPLGESGIQASAVAFGAWAIGGWMWGGADEKDAIDAIHAAIDNGINLIDTAPMYGFGRSEEVVGKAIKGKRDKVIVATKSSLIWDGTGTDGTYHFSTDEFAKIVDDTTKPKYDVYINGRPKHIRKGVEDSLRRLGTDVIDLFQTHWQDKTTPIADTMGELMRLKKEGKIRAIGCSNANPGQMDEYRAVGQLDCDQEKYNMLDRGMEETNLPYCAKNNIAFLAYSPLAQGLLTGAVGPDRVFEKSDQRSFNPRYSLENRRKIADFLETVKPVADAYQATYAQIVTAWTLSQPGCTHTLLGARNVKQVTENARGGSILLDSAAVEAINKAMKDKLGDVASHSF